MKIEEITLRNFRNYREMTLLPHEGVNLFFGANGSGKTNLLEAIHYCALGKSHRVTGDQNVIRMGEDFGVCGVTVVSGGVRRKITVRLVPNESVKKTITIDTRKIQRFSDMMGCLQCVIFSPEDLGLIREGPSLRRRYLDMMISQMNRGYFIALQQYRTGLEQRNALLRNLRAGTTGYSAGTRMLEVFEQAMAAPAAAIVAERKRIVHLLSGMAAETYRNISGLDTEDFRIGYHSSLKDEEAPEEAFRRALAESREDDIRLGVTSAGPHRDDLNLSLNRKNMKVFASQGQIRTAALSMKLAQMKALKQLAGEAPVLLLDDVMSELDRNRRTRLVSEISDYQTFITCTDETDLELDRTPRIYRVASPSGEAMVEEIASGAPIVMKEPAGEPDFT